MQLPNNTVPSESNFLAPFFPGAGLSSADAETLTSVGVPAGTGKFDQLFDGLNASPKPAGTPSPADLANLGFVACPMPFVPVAPVEEPIANAESDLEQTNVALGAGEVPAAGELPLSANPATGKAVGHSTRDSRIAARSAKAAESSDNAADTEQGTTVGTPTVPSNQDRPVNQPNEHASDVAFQTPRFTGLPETALQHRKAAGLPPGLTRLMAERSAIPAATEIPAEPTGSELVSSETDDAVGTLPLEGQEPTFGSRPTNWRGASGRNHPNPFPSPTALGRNNDDAESPIASGLTELTGTNEVLGNETAAAVHDLVQGGRIFGRDLGLALHERAVARASELSASTEDVAVDPDGADLASPNAADVLNREASKRDLPGVSRMAAKIADALHRRSDGTGVASEKHFVEHEEEHVASGRKHVGTDVAKPGADMFSRFLPTSAQPSASDHAVSVVAALDNTPDVAFHGETVPTETVSTAHEAVEVVLRTVEHASNQEQKSVNLQFSVGDANLSVRVELHANQVHTTFRTDSAELRAALSQEWENIAGNNPGDRTLKLVPAFVTASEHSALNSFAGDTSSRQRDQRAEREANERSVRVTSKSRGAVTATPVASSNAGISGTAPLTSRRLYTVA